MGGVSSERLISIKTGNQVYGAIKDIGRTSITFKLEARSHNVYDGRQAIILSTFITFVRIDEQGESIPISDRVKEKYKL